MKTAVLADAAGDLWFRVRHSARGLAHRDATPTRDTLERAVALGLSFLGGAQASNGAWTDFQLPPGASVGWVTAHVAFVLEQVTEARFLTERAARYLLTTGLCDGGWGYSRRVAIDCDTTAQALMVLRAHDIGVPPFIIDWLVSCESPTGGFPTYRPVNGHPANGWQVSHPDVTVMVVEALRRLWVGDASRQRALGWLDSVAEGPLVPSYWWPSGAYAAWAQTRCAIRASEAGACVENLIERHRSVPDLAMFLSAGCQSGHLSITSKRSNARALLAQQLSDGSWPCGPCLRVTDAAPSNPTDPLRGQLYAGARRVFSTAHAIAALSVAATQLDSAAPDVTPRPRRASALTSTTSGALL